MPTLLSASEWLRANAGAPLPPRLAPSVSAARRDVLRRVGAAGEPAHLAEIGVIKRDLVLELGGAAHMLDRLGELARLMQQYAEHVPGLGIVRLGRDDAAHDVVGIGDEPVPALLLGEH